jgi:hypothetical protein
MPTIRATPPLTNPSPRAAALLQQQAGTRTARPVAVGTPRAPVVANPATGNALVGKPRVPVAVGTPRPIAPAAAPVAPAAAPVAPVRDPVIDQQIRQRQVAALGQPRGLARNVPIPR